MHSGGARSTVPPVPGIGRRTPGRSAVYGDSRQQDVRSLVTRLFQQSRREPHLLLNLLQQHWARVVGAELARVSRPLRLERGVLTVAAPDACWNYELQFHKGELLNSVNTYLEGPGVQELRFRVAPWPAEAATPPAAASTTPEGPTPAAASSTPAPPAEADAPAPAADFTPAPETGPPAPIGDATLRSAFERSLGKRRRGYQRRTTEGRA